MKIFSVGKTRPVTFSLGSNHDSVMRAVRELDTIGVAKRLWAKDATLWSEADPDQVLQSLGWIDVVKRMHGEIDGITAFAEEAKGFSDVVLLGMGGSSLAPEVMASTFGRKKGYPALTVLDSTDPGAIARLEKRLDFDKTLFIVASKSGTTIEPNCFFDFFFEKSGERGENFIAITDRGSPLADFAEERDFRRIFLNPPDIGGRYSALSFFGLVPAALAGVDIKKLLRYASVMEAECSQNVEDKQNPAVFLGAALTALAKEGRDKVTILTCPEVASFAGWVEQLIAESTGKKGVGLVPIIDEPKGEIEAYGTDRVFVHIGTPFVEEHDIELIHYLEKDDQPMISIRVDDLYDLGGEFFRWEMAVAASGVKLGINPFDQPDVEAAKKLAREMLSGSDTVVKNVENGAKIDGKGFTIYLGEMAPSGMSTVAASSDPAEALRGIFKFLRDDDYIGLLPYFDPDDTEVGNLLSWIRGGLRDSLGTATQLGYGPRYLHSTGQLHKGGADNGLFFIFFHKDASAGDVAIPGRDYTFGGLESAQAMGDLVALQAKGRRAVIIELSAPYAEALKEVYAAFKAALEGRES